MSTNDCGCTLGFDGEAQPRVFTSFLDMLRKGGSFLDIPQINKKNIGSILDIQFDKCLKFGGQFST